MVYVDYVNKLGGSLCTIKKSTETLLLGSKEIGLEANTDETKYTVMSWDQNAGRSHSVSIASLRGWNSSNIWEQL